MPIDSSIALGVRAPNIGDIALDYQRAKMAKEDRARNQELLDLQIDRAKKEKDDYDKNAPNRVLESLGTRDTARLKSLVIAATEFKPLLESGNIEAVKSRAMVRRDALEKARLEGVDVDTTETDEFIKLLDTNPEAAKQAVNQTLQLGQQLGFLKAPEVQEQFEPVIEKGQVVAQRSTTTGKIVEDPRAPKTGRGDYFVPVQTASGVKAFDARKGVIVDPTTNKVIDTPVVGAQNDPTLQGKLSGAKEIGKNVGEAVSLVGGKYDALSSVREARSILDKGIYSGYWAETRKTIAKATPGIDKAKAVNTEQFMAYIGNTVVPRLKEFGGNDSNEEMRYLQRIMGGDITMEEGALRKVLESAEKKIDAGVKRLREQAKTIDATVADQESPAKPTVKWGDLK